MNQSRKHINPTVARLLVFALLLLAGLMPQRVAAQGYFTLTNGRLWWSNGLENQPDTAWRDPVAFDASNGWSEVHPHGTEHVTHITAQGDTYLALDISDPTQPHIISKPHSAFDLYCVWYRTGYTGYYYQEWFNDADQKTYRYYIVGSHDEGLEVIRSEVGQPLEKSTYWYNWDFGAAAWEKPTIDGASADRYYWIMLKERNRTDGRVLTPSEKEWVLSENSYQRPEDIYYTSYIAGDDAGNAIRRRHYDGVSDGFEYYPVGNGALFMPVTVTTHEKEIRSIEPNPSDGNNPYGLQGITLGTSVLEYDPAGTASTTLTADMTYKNNYKVPMTVMPAYSEYNEETYRRGIHLNYIERTQEVFGSAGVGTYRNHIFYNGTEHPNIPTLVSENASIDTIIFSVDNHSRRYVEVDPIAPMSTHPFSTTLRFHSPVSGTHTAYIYVTVRYDNGAEQRDTTTLQLRYEKPSRNPDPSKGPVVRGAVFGGGRMANVGGGTKVVVHSTDTLPTLYGGNDIAGWVQGDEGANLQIGTSFTDSIHPVHIGNVYGGGNGYYTYQGINAGYNEALDQHMNPYFWKKSTALGYQAYYFNGKVYPWNTLPDGYMNSASDADRINKDASAWSSLTPVVEHEFNYTPFYIGRPDLVDQAETGDDGDGTIPYIKTAHITVGVPESTPGTMLDANGHSTHHHNDYIVVDTLFGGARNAFIGVTANENETPENGVTIDINGGTLFSVFGGNNIGGSVANTSTVFVNVNDTKLLPADDDYNNSVFTGYGYDFGIRYLYGGGNLVDGSHASVNIYGGMIDTAFLGGNNATVLNPIGTVACVRGDSNEYGYAGHFICTNETYPDNSTFTSPNAALADNEHFFDNYGPDNFSPEEGKYNINCIFGGNNNADMANLTTIQLHSGGISSVYGGGNIGDMTNDSLYTVAGSGPGTGANQLFPQAFYNRLFMQTYDINPADGSLIDGGWAKTYGKNTLPNKVGTIVTALPDSKIICDYVFGGSRMGNVKNSCGVYLAGGVYGYVNGGNDVSGDVGSETGGGTYLVLDSNALVIGDAIAGSDGYYHCDDGTGHYDDGALYDTYADGGNAISYDPYDDYVGMLFPTHNNVNLYLRGGLVLGQLVGGGVHADVGFPQRDNYIRKLDTDPSSPTYGQRVEVPISLTSVGGAQKGAVHFMASGGRVVNNAFGGGFQSNINGLAYLTLRGNVQIDGSFFSGNDCTGSIRSFGAYINTDDYDAAIAAGKSEEEALAEAYGKMVASDSTKLNSNSGSWNADVSAYLRVEDTPEIGSIYGSGNGAYNYDGSRPQYESISHCSDPSGNITPKQSSTFIDIHTSGGSIGTIFGGGNGVGVEDKVVVLLNNTSDTVHTVGTIFGGNNVDDMLDVVPDIRLTQGVVNTVFGGANNGVMGAKKNFTDMLGNVVSNVSTHVVLESPHVTVLDTVFGGNRMSDVEGTSYVEVRNTKGTGVNYVFGGNDISGNITGIARVDISGGTVHNLFGGSDGRYDFVEIGDNLYKIYPFGSVASMDTVGKLITTAGRPDVDSTSLNLWGGAIGTADGGVYGGGSMAQSRATSVVVNDTVAGSDRNLTISGTIFGGGMGDWEHLDNRDLQGDRYGNITEATHVELHHADLVSSAKAYGGGRGGDVMNTYITVHDGWEQPFEYLYGGCWGSDVFGTTHVTLNGRNMGADQYNVRSLFGGNDFSGDVYKSDVTVNSGHFNNIYGAGNGDYPSGSYSTTQRRPNNEYVNLTFNDGEVDSNLYGGGKLGTTFAYQKDASRQYVVVGGHKVPDTSLTYTASHSDPLDYSYIIANIHGGVFHNNIFTGARGSRNDKTPLVYGLKVLNMDGGEVAESVYGGSESVNDGYPNECVSSSATTKRPSSILNITGGKIEGNLYGAGYLGLTHGSVYINIGTDAIDSCVAYSQVYKYGGVGSAAGAYRKFKPGASGSLSPALVANELLLNHSIYAGSNWGSAHGTADFTAPGFFGGESKVRIDGKDYNTDNDELNILPQMNIVKSVFCSGTSVNGGDVMGSKEIDIWNYGSTVNCHPSRKLESVQRGDRLTFHNSAVELTGATDATSAYYSNPYSLNNITSLDFRGYNVLELDASVDNVPGVNFYEEALLVDGSGDPVPIQNLRQYTSNTACEDSATTCSNLEVIDPEMSGMQHTLLVLNNGIDFQVRQSTPMEGTGMVTGFGYVTVPQGYSSTILASATVMNGTSAIRPSNYDWNSGAAGFASSCDTTNKYTEDRGLVDWRNFATNAERLASEVPYTNYNNPSTYGDYRVWEVGIGTRLRETTILAHTDPTHLPQDVSIFTHGNEKMAIAEASVKLPATSTGHYYKVISGINLVGENETVNLIDSAFLPARSFGELNTRYNPAGSTHGTVDVVPPVYGEFLGTTLALGGVATGVNEIIDHPTSTFGLVMVPGKFFDGYSSDYFRPGDATYVMPDPDDPSDPARTPDQSFFVLSGNSHVTSIQDYCSPKVAPGEALTPVMNFYLTYNTEFTSSFLGTVNFIMMEYDENGNEVAPIEMKVYISTIIEEFKPISTNVLAMYNAGRSNTFSRKVVLPATLEEDRQLYIKSLRWVPTDCNGNDSVESNKFYLVGGEGTITGAPANNRNLFAINIIPSDNLSSEVSSAIGWSHINMSDINLYNLKTPHHTAPSRYSDSTGWQHPRAIDFSNNDASDGLLIGTLDGRGSAVLDVQLTFDGKRRYSDIKGLGYIGKIEIMLKSRLNEVTQEFPLTIYVKTREHGDSIYVATEPLVARGGHTVHPYEDNPTYQYWTRPGASSVEKDAAAKMVGKSPNCYVRTFQEALSTKVYEEGDVICILDTVKIEQGLGIAIHGGDGPAVEVIRYDGHHHEMPGEEGVYRGPMIRVKKAGSKFTATNIAFHGGAGAVIKKGTPLGPQQPDTNRVFGPVLQVQERGAVTLTNGTSVRYNWNAYGSEAGQLTFGGLPADASLMGAINVMGGGTLTLQNNVEISCNLSHTFNGDNPTSSSYDALRPYNGAVYVDGGRVVLPQSNAATAVDITRNWLVNPAIHTPGSNIRWWKNVEINGTVVRYTFDEGRVADWQLANLLLTRTANPSGNVELDDAQSDVISLTGSVAPGTHIGVRKWFPGPEVRDTIRIATCGESNLTLLSKAVQNGNFLSDDGQRVFYSPKVNNNAIFLIRCATLRHQMQGVSLPLAGYEGRDVLRYGILASNSCPLGGDSIIYNIQGGFAPYTYTWTLRGTGGASDVVMREYTSPYPNTLVQNGLNHGVEDYFWASISDTLLTPPVDMHNEMNHQADVNVVVVDATGVCSLTKDLTIRLHRVAEIEDIPGDHSKWQPVTSPNGWADTVSYVTANRKTAVGDRYYKAIKITPVIFADPSAGRIIATVDGDYQLYQYIDEEHRNDLANVLFCEGDVIHLKTQANLAGYTFLMWNFAPFNENPATYVVPSYDAEVIAYYGTNDYWTEVINTSVRGGATIYEGYNYTSRPTNVTSYKHYYGTGSENTTLAGYVTTYNGDVHIYNENGLAWFISVVNGLNGEQARPFQFNTVYLHKKDAANTPYDMRQFLWTPIGTRQYGFRGRLMGVSEAEGSTTPLTGDDRVIISNIILNEPDMNYVGFFGLLESASCSGIELQDILVRGGQYVGGLAAQSSESTVDNCAVVGSSASRLPILTTNYVSGGIVGDALQSEIKNSVSEAKYTGNAVHSGGITGKGTVNNITNNSAYVKDYMSGLYVGGVTGSESGEEVEDNCSPTNLRAAITGINEEPSAAGAVSSTYTVSVSWQSSDDDVMVSYCSGESWYESADFPATWVDVDGNSVVLNIPVPFDTSIHGYTIAVKADCSESATSMATTYVSCENYIPCPEYWVEGVVVSNDDGRPMLHASWGGELLDEDNEMVTIGYCIGTSWNADNATTARVNIFDGQNGYNFVLSTPIATSYMVGLYSTCSGQWIYGNVEIAPRDSSFTPEGYSRRLADNSRHHAHGRKRNDGRSLIANNYVYIDGDSRAQRIGGIAGHAANTDIMNNYVYGSVSGSETGGSVTAVMESGTRAEDNFAAHGTATRNVGRQMGGMVSNGLGFAGAGNRVILDKKILGVDNLTRALNRWVRQHNADGGHFKTWRSDLESVNNGYPIFGEPDMIPVEASTVMEGCEEVVLDGVTYTRDTVVTTRVVDYVEMVDSSVTATIHLHYGTHTQVSDTVEYGSDYRGYGFYIGADELRMLDQTIGTEGRASITLHDTLTTAFGCDSIVTLTLTFTGSPDEPPLVETEFNVNVYPNPTTSIVNVEAEGMTHVEVYDNEGRRLQDYDAAGRDKITIDMTKYVSGVYFVRVHSPKTVLIQKVIKER